MLPQYPYEREVLFAPLTGIEMRGSRIEGSTVVAEMVLSVNLMSPTIEQVVSKMKRSHLTLLDLLIERLASANAPKATQQVMRLPPGSSQHGDHTSFPSSLALAPFTHPSIPRSLPAAPPHHLPPFLSLRWSQELIERREQQAQRKAEDFNAPDAYQAATNAALLAQRRALSMLATAQAASWRAPLPRIPVSSRLRRTWSCSCSCSCSCSWMFVFVFVFVFVFS